jgi:CheY-like chemotaxis protein
MLTLLLIDDSPDDARLLARDVNRPTSTSQLLGGRVSVRSVSTLEAATTILADGGVDVVVLDLNLPDAKGLDAVRLLTRQFPFVPVVVVSGLDDERLANDAVHAGAQDYLVKGTFEPRVLQRVISYAIGRLNNAALVEDIKQSILRYESKMKRLDEVGKQISQVKEVVEKLGEEEKKS